MVGRLLAKQLTSQREIYKAMMPIAEERIHEKAQKQLGHKVPIHVSY